MPDRQSIAERLAIDDVQERTLSNWQSSATYFRNTPYLRNRTFTSGRKTWPRKQIDRDHTQPAVIIDDLELDWEEFGRLLSVYSGWGMRIEFVPEEDTHKRPKVVVTEPEESK